VAKLPVDTMSFAPTVAAGSFQMGCTTTSDPECNLWEQPVHAVTVPAFRVDRTEETASAYLACVAVGSCTPAACDLAALPPGSPAICTTWDQAGAFCAWEGKRLCTEAEWEKSARGLDGRTYPWGDAPAPSCTQAVMYDGTAGACGTGAVWPVGSKPAGASPCGAVDMMGNAWEWVEDCYQTGYAGAPTDGSARTSCTDSGRVNRGGGFDNLAPVLRGASRTGADPGLALVNQSFRCCQTVQ